MHRRHTPSGAHVGIVTRSHQHGEGTFEAFCERQASRVRVVAGATHRRYVKRVLTLIAVETPDVTIKGYSFGGGPSPSHDD